MKMLKRNFALAVATCALLAATPLRAEISGENVQQLLSSKNESSRTLGMSVIYSTFNGLFWANVQLGNDNNALLFCQPVKLAMSAEQSVVIFEQKMKENPKMAGYPLGMIMLIALKETFPCE